MHILRPNRQVNIVALAAVLVLFAMACAESSATLAPTAPPQPTATPQPTTTPQPSATPDPKIGELGAQLDRLSERVARTEARLAPTPTSTPAPTLTPTPSPTPTPTPEPSPAPAGGDTTPPNFVEVSFTPSSVSVSKDDGEISITVRIAEDLSGLERAVIIYRSPSGNQHRRANFTPEAFTTGAQREEAYETTLTIPRFSEGGSWVMLQAHLIDRVGNSRNYTRDDFVALGFPSSFDIVYEE